MALPTWNGADHCYRKAYRILASMAARGHAMPPTGRHHHRRGVSYSFSGYVSQEMRDLIEALNKGDEETIKGLLLMDHIYY